MYENNKNLATPATNDVEGIDHHAGYIKECWSKVYNASSQFFKVEQIC